MLWFMGGGATPYFVQLWASKLRILLHDCMSLLESFSDSDLLQVKYRIITAQNFSSIVNLHGVSGGVGT